MFTVTVQDGSEAHLEPRSLAGADVVCCRALVRPEGESGGRTRRSPRQAGNRRDWPSSPAPACGP